ncbi:MAG: uncharacterized protein PWP65_1896 [Clostridia bacterium]|nr:uncharacterized protein [Clostridia bacterium]
MVRLSRKLDMITLSDEQLQAMVKYIIKQRDILGFYLYGSYGTELQTPLSDLDLAVLPMPGSRLDLQRELEIWSELAHIGKNDDINLINLGEVPVTLQMRVLQTGRLLFSRDDALLADFKERVIRRYCDFAPDLKAFYRDFDAGLREEFK